MEHEGDSRPPLIVAIFNGLRHDFPELYEKRGLNLSSLRTLLSQGVRAAHVSSVNPTDSMPNYWSMLTGLYPGNHCVPFDTFMDRDKPGKVFRRRNLTGLTDLTGFPEPLWLTNQRSGGKSLVLLPGSAMLFDGSSTALPVGSGPGASVDLLLNWLAKPGKKVGLAFLYFDEPGAAARAHGPVSNEVGVKLLELDGLLGKLLHGLRRLGMLDSVNLIVTADHGVAAVDPNKVIELNAQLPADWFDNRLGSQTGAHAQLWPKAGHSAADLVARLSKSAAAKLKAWEAARLPPELHMSGCPWRLPPVYVRADPPWLLRLSPGAPLPKGVSGYAADTEDMRPLWLARGPDFQRDGAQVSLPIELVDFYPLACQLMGLTPRPHNGSLLRIAPVLAQGEGFLATFAGVLILFAFFGVILLVTAFVTSRRPAKTVRGELGP